jgi:hypothetical protein
MLVTLSIPDAGPCLLLTREWQDGRDVGASTVLTDHSGDMLGLL